MMYKIVLNTQELLLLGECIDAMPLGKVAALHSKIQQQVTQQEIEDQKRVLPSPPSSSAPTTDAGPSPLKLPTVDMSKGPVPELNLTTAPEAGEKKEG